MSNLDQYQKEFEAVKQSNSSQERKSLLYANIMTRMEHDFHISIIGSNKGNPAIPLYKEISQARSI